MVPSPGMSRNALPTMLLMIFSKRAALARAATKVAAMKESKSKNPYNCLFLANAQLLSPKDKKGRVQEYDSLVGKV